MVCFLLIFCTITHRLLTNDNPRFISLDDYAWFEKTILRVVAEDMDEETYIPIVKPTYFFGDFMRYNQICMRKVDHCNTYIYIC